MVLYNVTIGIDRSIENEWLKWMLKEHVPEVMKTGMFESNKIFKVLGQEQEETASYSFQYFATSMSHIDKYLNEYAPKLVEKHRAKYQNRHVAFRTLLEEVLQ